MKNKKSLFLLPLLLFALATASCKATPLSYTITFDPNNGESPFTQEVEENKKATKPIDPFRDEYVFNGWYTDTNEFWVFAGYPVTEDMTLTAKYELAQNGTDDLVFSPTITDGILEYVVTSYIGNENNIIIPGFFNGAKVSAIGNKAFCTIEGELQNINNGKIESIVISENIRQIGFMAFFGCTSLTSIVIPNSVTTIGDWAFYNCTSLTSIVIPNSVTTIGDYAFYNCTSLTIYAEASSKPSGWNSYWNPSNRPVVWGYVG